MAQVNKIDSNQTELRYAEETTVGVLPGTPTWVQLDPNEYDDFGGEIVTVARNPINSGRQRKKGVVVDLNADGGFTIDLTPDVQDLMQGFMFADLRRKSELSVANVDGTNNDYEPASGGTGYHVGDLLFAKGFTQSANNGLKVVTSPITSTSVPVTDTGLVAEVGASGIISRVGFEFASGNVVVDTTGNYAKLTNTLTAAFRSLTLSGVANNNETVTIGSTVYTFKTALTGGTTPFEVLIGANAAASVANLVAAINAAAGAGTTYGTGTTAHPDVTAIDDIGDVVTVTAKVGGIDGNDIVTTETMTNGAWGGATLSGGVGRSFSKLGIVPGEWVCVGDDAVGTSFATAANNGLKRVKSTTGAPTSSELLIDKSSLAMVNDTGTGKTIRLVFGRVLKNETGTLVKRRSYQLERSLGAPDDALPTQVQSEYLTGSIANEFKLNVEQADKVTAELSFMSRDHETRTGAQGLKSGNRPTPTDSDAFNATSHVRRLRLALIDAASEAPTDLFAFVMDLSISINNNVSANKAVKFLGAFDNTAGTFEVDAEMQAYFANVSAVQAVRNNSDATLDLTFGQDKKGITVDMPLVSIGNARANVEQDEPIMLPIENAAATAAKYDPNMNHTLLLVFWDYLPDLAS